MIKLIICIYIYKMYDILLDLNLQTNKEKQQIIVSSLIRNYRIITTYDPFYHKFKDKRMFEKYLKKKYNYFLGTIPKRKY